MSSGSSSRRVVFGLWLVLLVAWPLPMLGLEGSYVPVGRYLQLAGGLSILAIVEDAEGMTGLFVMLLWTHVVLYGALLLAIAFLLNRLIGRVAGAQRRMVALVVGLAVVAWVWVAEPYDSQFHHSDAHASLLDLYR